MSKSANTGIRSGGETGSPIMPIIVENGNGNHSPRQKDTHISSLMKEAIESTSKHPSQDSHSVKKTLIVYSKNSSSKKKVYPTHNKPLHGSQVPTVQPIRSRW